MDQKVKDSSTRSGYYFQREVELVKCCSVYSPPPSPQGQGASQAPVIDYLFIFTIIIVIIIIIIIIITLIHIAAQKERLLILFHLSSTFA